MKSIPAATIMVPIAAILLHRTADAEDCGAVCQEMEHISTQAPLLAETIRSAAQQMAGSSFLDRLESVNGELESSRARCEGQAAVWGDEDSCEDIQSVVERYNDIAADYSLALLERAGLEAYMNGDYSRAIHAYSLALGLRPDLLQAHFGRGLCYAAVGQHGPAVSDYTRATELMLADAGASKSNDVARVFHERGLAWLGKQDPVRGCFDLQKACEFGSCEALQLEQKKGACSDFADQLPVREVRASHILLESGYKAQKLLRRIDQGEAFGDLAREYSKCPSSEKGGDLGFFERGQMVKEFDDVAFSTPKGIVTGPVRTEFGYHLIKVTDMRQ